MFRIIAIIAFTFAFVGCSGMTSAGVAEKMMPQYQKSYELSVKAKAAVTQRVMEALTNINRGGMKLDLDQEGRVKSISYVEHLDLSVVKKALDIPEMQLPKVKSGIEEAGDFLRAATGIVVPLGALHYGYKVTESNNDVEKHRIDSQVKITEINANASTSSDSNTTE